SNTAHTATLQWGRGFLAAETAELFSIVPSTATLQWGRGFLAAETRSSIERSGGSILTSMGPRLFSRGNHGANLLIVDDPIKLQWGRGFLAAETLPFVPPLTATSIL